MFLGSQTKRQQLLVLEKILKLKSLCSPMVKFMVGNGKNIYLWYDNWHPKGPLLNTFGPIAHFLTGIPLDIKLSAVIKYSISPRTRSITVLEIQRHLVDFPPQGIKDRAVWVPSKSENFHTGATWSMIR